MADTAAPRRITMNRRIVGPPAPRPITVQSRKMSDFPGLSADKQAVIRLYSSPLLLGPPICEELVALIDHTYSDEEASLVRHLQGFVGKSDRSVARKAHRPVEEVTPILERLAFGRRSIGATGRPDKRRYFVLPIVPGLFESVLIAVDPQNLSPWELGFAQLFEAIFETGYLANYSQHRTEAVRFMPVKAAMGSHPLALPSDQLEVVFDRYETFGIGQCQCRTTAIAVGKGCGKPQGNCTVIGDWAAHGIEHGYLKQVSRDDAIAIKREGEEHGLVNWIMNVESSKGQVSCSCCGCCCHAMRMVNEFNVPAIAAPPHFQPRFDRDKCTHCGKCARACPMGALVIDTKTKTDWQLMERCVGCGLCLVACDKVKAVTMEPVADYRLPPDSWFATISRSAPNLIRSAVDGIKARYR